MDADFEIRKEGLLNECEVAPQVFARVAPRLERFGCNRLRALPHITQLVQHNK